MKTITVPMIRAFVPPPCYEPTEVIPEDWEGTAIDMLKEKRVPPEDRLWVVLREEFIDAKTLRLFACRCVRGTPLPDGRTVWDLLTDERSRHAVDVAERYAVGEATGDELAAACDAACAAAGDVALAAAGATALFAARSAALAAARAVARDAACDAAREWQCNMLVGMLAGKELETL